MDTYHDEHLPTYITIEKLNISDFLPKGGFCYKAATASWTSARDSIPALKPIVLIKIYEPTLSNLLASRINENNLQLTGNSYNFAITIHTKGQSNGPKLYNISNKIYCIVVPHNIHMINKDIIKTTNAASAFIRYERLMKQTGKREEIKKNQKKIKIDRYELNVYPLTQVNIKSLVDHIYPMKILPEICPICRKKLNTEYTYAFQINETECIKDTGNVCLNCNAYFTDRNTIIEYIKKNIGKSTGYTLHYNYFHRIKPDTYSTSINNPDIIRQYFLTNERESVAVSLTTNLLIQDMNNLIFYYYSEIGYSFLKTEKEKNYLYDFNGTKYSIIKTIKKPFDRETTDKITALQNMKYPPSKNPTISSEQTLYIYKGTIQCHKNHHCNEYKAMIPVFDKEYRFYVEYCHECDKFIMKYDDYVRYIDRFMVFPMKVQYNSPQNYDYSLSDYSPLLLAGYNVNQNENLSASTRQKILSFIVDHQILSKRKVLNYLEQFINRGCNNLGFELAVEKWKADKEFLLSYSPPDTPNVIIGRLEKK